MAPRKKAAALSAEHTETVPPVQGHQEGGMAYGPNGFHGTPARARSAGGGSHFDELGNMLLRAAPIILALLGGLYAGGWIVGPAKQSTVDALSIELKTYIESQKDINRTLVEGQKEAAKLFSERAKTQEDLNVQTLVWQGRVEEILKAMQTKPEAESYLPKQSLPATPPQTQKPRQTSPHRSSLFRF